MSLKKDLIDKQARFWVLMAGGSTLTGGRPTSQLGLLLRRVRRVLPRPSVRCRRGAAKASKFDYAELATMVQSKLCSKQSASRPLDQSG